MDHKGLLRALLDRLEKSPDHAVSELVAEPGSFLVGVESRRLGIASWAGDHPGPLDLFIGERLPDSAKELARHLLRDDASEASVGQAAFNSLLSPPDRGHLRSIKAQDLILRHGRGRKVAVIGHFPFVERIGPELAQLWVLEKRPRPGDLAADQAPAILPQADVIAISATTLANGTLADILTLSADSAKKILLGPSTPLIDVLFEVGLDALCGVLIADPGAVKRGIREGRPFKRLQGVEYVVWERH